MSTHPGRCAQCGYDLSGIAPSDACPECGSRARRAANRSTKHHGTWFWAAIPAALLPLPLFCVFAPTLHVGAAVFVVGLLLGGLLHVGLVTLMAMRDARDGRKVSALPVALAATIDVAGGFLLILWLLLRHPGGA